MRERTRGAGALRGRGDGRPRRAATRAAAASACAAALLLLASAPPAAAQAGVDRQRRAAARDSGRGEVAGLRLGSWDVTGLERLPEASYSTIPAFEVYYQRGQGERASLHLGLGLWRRGRVSSAGTLGMWVAPLFAGAKYYPLDDSGGRLDPYLSLAGGPALGFELRRSSGSGTLSSGWTAAIGGGGEVGAGLELGLSERLGVTIGAQYQWVRYFAGRLDGPGTYRGALFGGGVTYRLDLGR